ncbi:phage regulatory CII family protein [Thiomicrorhabdus lithotrophica]|uniref:Uncharacterized protein n=1 Tax=Thiomicrorhabdus lithotrophica TaxID=2949997 RepID=A0ABY8C876_9GAMM|nr:phage regulatory CII family protein [Thiomicrorhabdus lithotrophica]WEJ62171.1 hypothetical protein NR989_09135 [Thiomicrorhabdus lithotrophica]
MSIRYLRKSVAEKIDPHSLADLKIMVNHIHRLTHNCRGGVERLARKLGYGSGQDIINEVNPFGESRAKPGFLDVILWVRETQNFALLDEVDEFVGRSDLQSNAVNVSCSLVENAASAIKESSDVVVEVAQSMADGNVSDNDLIRIHKEADEAIAKLIEVKQHARELNGNG